ncbi:adenylate/guanylate cyclase domain-containing protein [Ruegeria pomeroyi]|uniref:Adenylate/guanylate cyclase domain-containing protein n=2 Tax=Ruegeria pomeroyi TaxID=89184 RepID=A0A9Q3ZLM8_9RHOB|nr:adenylate/guanylate cyclase domain-containing protein [Ruegeria pomeroyi]MCE8537178.1 adenylate/guanylate cyclase domain-containing protein [Ruegeria pomeroyi]
MTRRLTAILAADVVGFSVMMGRDEAGTLARLIDMRKTVFDPEVARTGGRIVKLMGDGALVEFSSVANAVSCAIAVQERLAADPTLKLRIGINLGDVILQGSDLYGDGVNIAARLEALAEPGGICVSGPVADSLGSRLDPRFADTGLQPLKNIEKPVRVLRWLANMEPAIALAEPGFDRPGIAVLAFDNMSADPEQEYFSDGIAEDIIAALSHFREFKVIARNTTFTYKGKAVRVDQVCRDLGVRYLLEGSVRKAGNKVRVTAQLIDGETGAHLWADRYDRSIDDIFAVQDEITQAIVEAVAPETMNAEFKRARNRPESLSSWDKVLRARWYLGKFSQPDNHEARALLSQIVASDPNMSEAHAGIALCDLMAMLHVWRTDTGVAIQSAKASAAKAVEQDDNSANAHAIMGMACLFARDFDEGETHLMRAIRLNPNLAVGYGNCAALYGVSGQYPEARAAYERAAALSPRDPLKPFWRGGFGIGAYVAADFETCLHNAQAGLKETPAYASLMRQEAAALAMLGRQEEARASVARLVEKMPGLTVTRVRAIVPVRNEADWELWLEGLRRAGLPE